MNYEQYIEGMPVDKAWTSEEEREYFIRECSNLAFGDEAIERGYGMEEVIEELKEFSDNALKYEEGEE